MCCFICFHLKVDFSVQWCTAREQVYCDFMLFQWRSRTLSGKHQGANSSKQPLNLIILIVFICEVQNNVVQATFLATLRMAQLVLSIFLPIYFMQNEPLFRIPTKAR